MAEGTYEYECMRAELLGIEKPDYEEFIKNKEQQGSSAAVAEEEQDNENLKEADQQNEQMRNVSGGLDELNSILQVTQRKIHKFKASCGSLTNLLKFRISGTSSETGEPTVDVKSEEETEDSSCVTPSTTPTNVTPCSNGERKSDLAKALDNHEDKLDSMTDKAENAQFSMSHQIKEMKRFLK